MLENKSIAIIFTCFNRKEKTVNCLNSLVSQLNNHEGSIAWVFYVCDDRSTDGTREMLEAFGDKVRIIDGGDLYWDKGMHTAMLEAIKEPHDFYLMINDDVDFYEDGIQTMLESYEEAGGNCGISGPTKMINGNETTYGGKLFGQTSFLDPNGTLQKCNLANWNCFLVDQGIIDKIGIIDPNYDHSYGDYDYSMMMQRHGYSVFLAKGYIGECDRNTSEGTFKDKSLPRKARIKKFFSPKGMPLRSGIRYYCKNMDFLGIVSLIRFLGAYARNLMVVLLC